MVATRAKLLSVVAVSSLMVLGTTVASSASPTTTTAPEPSSAKLKDSGPIGENLPPTPLQADQQADKLAAIEAVATGEAKVKQGGVQLPNGDWVQWGTPDEDEILTFLVEFGDQIGEQGGDAGPKRNEIPQPDRDWDGDATDDNSTAWRDDFTRESYEEMLFGDDGMSMSDFYLRQSSGQYTVGGSVEDWVTVPYNEARYGANATEDEGYPAFIQDTAQAWYDSQAAAGKSSDEIAEYLKQFDEWDRYDFDGDGTFDEPDGYIDHFQAIHAGEGEEAGGGAQGEDAIWSHRWFAYTGLTGPDHNPQGGAPIGDTGLWIGDYTTEPENGGLGVFCHEYGHDLGLPDLYDTQGGTNGTGRWTLMSGGSWMNTGNDNIGDMPNYMGPWEKYFLGWLDYDTVKLDDNSDVQTLGAAGAAWPFKQATKIELPDKEETREYTKPFSGEYEWMAGEGDDLNSTLTRDLDLSGGSSAELSAKVRLDTEAGYDYFTGEVSTDGGGTWTQVGDAYDGDSGEFVDVDFDLSEYAGEQIKFRYRYVSDANTHGTGVFVDDVTLTVDDEVAFSDDIESGDNGWTALGWKRTTGTEQLTHARFYLAENRRYTGYDESLKYGPYNFGWGSERPDFVERYPYQDGMVVWYVNTQMTDNNTSLHPGEGLVLPVDSHPSPMTWSDGTLVNPTHQVYDASFTNAKTDKMTLHKNGVATEFASHKGVSTFNDSDPDKYWSADLPSSSVKVAGEGVKISVIYDGGKWAPMIIKVTRS
jgi:immune inhibitor A